LLDLFSPEGKDAKFLVTKHCERAKYFVRKCKNGRTQWCGKYTELRQAQTAARQKVDENWLNLVDAWGLDFRC
jgi:hypothetical protein